MTAIASHTSENLLRKLDSTVTHMEELYTYARILRSEIAYSRGEYKTHTSAKSLIYELENE
jgi:hypothetical protein